MHNDKTRRHLALASLITVAVSTWLYSTPGAQDPVIAKRLTAIDTQIAAIHKRLSALESPPTTVKPVSSSNVNSAGWKTLRNWDRVKKGMSFAQVQEILGVPTKIVSTLPDSPTYYYEGTLVSGDLAGGRISFYERRVLTIAKPVL